MNGEKLNSTDCYGCHQMKCPMSQTNPLPGERGPVYWGALFSVNNKAPRVEIHAKYKRKQVIRANPSFST